MSTQPTAPVPRGRLDQSGSRTVARPPGGRHAGHHTPPGSAAVAALLLAGEGAAGLVHSVLVMQGVTLAEETLGLGALRLIGGEMTVAVVLFLLSGGLFLAAAFLLRRSRLAQVLALAFQVLALMDASARIVRGLPVAPALALAAAATISGLLLLSRPVRRWCTIPILD